MGLIVVLLMICWLWWDKMHQIKWVAAECLADAINAKRMADHKALEAIGQYNRHIEMCNRVIEGQESGVGGGQGTSDWQQEIRDLQTQLATERTESARLDAERKKQDESQTQLERRLAHMETLIEDRQNGANAELLARLQRAEAELANQKPGRR
jgi:septal ring factor EnvC (AmiA/AmiB activator)